MEIGSSQEMKEGLITSKDPRFPANKYKRQKGNTGQLGGGCIDAQMINVEDDDEDTVTHENHQNKHLTRVDARLKVPASLQPDKALAIVAKAVLTKLQEMDSSIRILPWATGSRTPHIRGSSDVPNTMGKFKQYFPRIFPNKKGGGMYTSILIGHDKIFPDIIDDIAWWLKQEGHGLWVRTLQCENVAKLGWLLYSAREMDKESLSEEIGDRIGTAVAVRFKVISIGRKGSIPDEQRVQALHVEVNREEKPAAWRRLKELYGATSRPPHVYPNCTRMRLVPEIESALNKTARGKIERLRAKQQQFLKAICKVTSWDIMALDHRTKNTTPNDPDECKHEGMPRSLRELLARIKDPGNEKVHLFHTVERSWNDNTGFVFLVLPHLESEARMLVSGLVPYLQFHFGNYINKYFSEEVVEEMKDAKWDPENQCVISSSDGVIDSAIEDDEIGECIKEFVKSGATSMIAADDSNQAAESNRYRHQRPDPMVIQRSQNLLDDNSVSTMGSIGTRASRAVMSTNISNATPLHSQETVAVSEMSILSLESQVTNIVERSVKTQLDAFEHKISSLFSRMEQTERVPTERARLPTEVDNTAIQGDSSESLQ